MKENGLQFKGGITREALIGRLVAVLMKHDGPNVNFSTCKVFDRDGLLMLDCYPPKPGLSVAPLPDDSVVCPGIAGSPFVAALVIDSQSDAARILKAQKALRQQGSN